MKRTDLKKHAAALLLVLCLVAFCLQAEAALPATDQNLEAAIAYGKSYQGEKNDAVMLQPWVIAESFETNPYRCLLYTSPSPRDTR